MIQDIVARQELLMLVGQPVHVKATLVRLGTLPGRTDRTEYATALLSDIQLEGIEAPITHAWIRLGKTGSKRARKYDLYNCPVELDAIVVAYRGGTGGTEVRLGLGDASNIIAFCGGRWRTVARSQEIVETEVGERISQSYIDRMLSQMLWNNQRPVMERAQTYALSRRIDRATASAIDHFFIRHEPVSAKQLRHVSGVLGDT